MTKHPTHDEHKDEEYLDKEFPKGKTKFRGQAMVLLALAKQHGRLEERKEILKVIKKFKFDFGNDREKLIQSIKEIK